MAHRRARALITVLSTASLALTSRPLLADPAEIGREVSISRHLQDGEEQQLPLGGLLAHGQRLLAAPWTNQEGGGRPLTKGTGAGLADPDRPLAFPFNFNRISAPDANSCAGCHAQPFGVTGGGGDFVANVFVLGQRFDFVTFDNDDQTPTRGCADESGEAVTLDMIANGRATLGMFGSGYIEMLARQMTTDLQALRNAIPPGGETFLLTKGVFFGVLARRTDGTWDSSRVEGLPAPSLASAGADAPPSLIVRPFHQAGAVISLRQFTNNAFNHHHGIQTTERFGDGTDPDGDGVTDEMTRADVTAATLFQATMAVPGRVIPRDPDVERAVLLGERRFTEVGCAGCHVPALPLTGGGSVFTEPNPFNPAGNLRPGDALALAVDLNDPHLPSPRLRAVGGVTLVPAFTDLKLHDITNGPDDPNREPLDMHAAPDSPQFRAGNSRFLTKKLWGAANEPPYFHHGKFTTMRQAVLAHAGEAQAATDAFRALPSEEQDCVIEFLKTLQVLPPGTRALVVDQRGEPRSWPPQGCEPSLADYARAWRHVRFGAPLGADPTCVDQAPGTIACRPSSGPAHWCAEPDGRVTEADLDALRRLVSRAWLLSCDPCGPTNAPAASSPVPGDASPSEAGGDGRVDVADAVLALRWAVGLDTPPADALRRADVAPATPEADGTTSAGGDGRIDVADVVLLLRAAVGTTSLQWPERSLVVRLDSAATVGAFRVTLRGMPADARITSVSSSACTAEEAGAEATGDVVAIACAAGGSVGGPAELLVLRYRAPAAIDPASLSLETEILDGSDAPLTAQASLAAR